MVFDIFFIPRVLAIFFTTDFYKINFISMIVVLKIRE